MAESEIGVVASSTGLTQRGRQSSRAAQGPSTSSRSSSEWTLAGENDAGSEVEQRPRGEDVVQKEEESKERKSILPKIEMEIEKVVHWAWNAISFESLPHWLRDNEFLRHNHRPPMYSFRGCFKSMFRLHTETWNIWTHLVGFIFFVVLSLGVYVFGDYITWLFEDVQIHNLPWDEQAMLFLFFLGAMACLCCSFLFHLFSSHSHKIFVLFSRLDYSGIAFLITGSSVPAYYYGFYCMRLERYTHMTILITLCVLCVSISLWKKFSTPAYRPLRAFVFLTFGLYGFIPSLHVLFREGFTKATTGYALWGMLLMGCLYICGACFYISRIPERFFPGKFDIWVNSHQVFHVFVLLAALVHYDTLLSMVKYRLHEGGCMAEVLPIPDDVTPVPIPI